MADLVGQQLGIYRLIRLLGRGGFAEVYLGQHIHLQSLVAIRVLPPQTFREHTDGLRSEIQTLANLRHPNILAILDFDLEGRPPFIVEEYAPNGTLRQRHPGGAQLPLDTIIPYVRQVASALDYVHSQKIIHGDVKPENMLIGPNNEILLSDLGIAVSAPDIGSPTIIGPVAGTAAYMAPEQLQGRPDPASDQYSLGIVVYEWLSGYPPFQGSFTEVAYRHVSTPPPFLREKVPTIPPAVEQVVMIALAKDPAQRFDGVETFANALREAHLASSAVLPAMLPIKEAVLSGSFGRKTLGAKALTIGRIEGNGLVIKDREVSRRQAEIRPAGQDYSIIDFDSMNGTYVNEQRIPSQTPYLLKTGDTIRMGKSKMTYEGSEIPGSTSGGPSTVDSPVMVSSDASASTVMNKIETPAHLILRADTGEVLHDYTLDKWEMSIGRAPNSDILLSIDKLTSRHHATVLYENDRYAIRDERSANGTFVNSQQLDERSTRVLEDGDHIGIGEHELIFQEPASSSVDIESMPTMTVNASNAAKMTYRTRDDENLTAARDEEYGTRSIEGSNVKGYEESVSALPSLAGTPGSARPPVEKTELSLFAITNVVLDEGDIAFVGKMYALQAGIARNKPDDFWGEPFELAVENVTEPITFDILLHESENIELITNWHRRLRYRPDDAEPQLALFKFQVVTPGKSLLVIDFYHERCWLRTMHFEFDAVEQSQHVPVSSEV